MRLPLPGSPHLLTPPGKSFSACTDVARSLQTSPPHVTLPRGRADPEHGSPPALPPSSPAPSPHLLRGPDTRPSALGRGVRWAPRHSESCQPGSPHCSHPFPPRTLSYHQTTASTAGHQHGHWTTRSQTLPVLSVVKGPNAESQWHSSSCPSVSSSPGQSLGLWLSRLLMTSGHLFFFSLALPRG